MRLWQIKVSKRVLNQVLCTLLILCLLIPHYSAMQVLLQKQVLDSIKRNHLDIHIIIRLCLSSDNPTHVKKYRSVLTVASILSSNPGLNLITRINYIYSLVDRFVGELVFVIVTLVSELQKFISVSLARNILQTIAYRVFERLFDLSTALKFFNINNPTPFLLQHWLKGASVGGIAASSEAHALSLLSVRLAAMCGAARHLLGVDMCESIHRFRGGRSYGAAVT